jgi:hypothetical protein
MYLVLVPTFPPFGGATSPNRQVCLENNLESTSSFQKISADMEEPYYSTTKNTRGEG